MDWKRERRYTQKFEFMISSGWYTYTVFHNKWIIQIWVTTLIENLRLRAGTELSAFNKCSKI